MERKCYRHKTCPNQYKRFLTKPFHGRVFPKIITRLRLRDSKTEVDRQRWGQ